MIALKVIISGTEYVLDTYKNDPINLKLQYSNIEKIQSAVGTFSQSFRIPATDKNRAAFGNFDSSTEVGGVNPKQKIEAWIEVDTIPIVSGFVQLNEAIVHKNSQADFKLTFFGQNTDFFKALGDAKLSDLDLSDLNYELNYTNYLLGQNANLFSGAVRHALMDKGRIPWNNTITEFNLNENNPIELSDLVPIVKTSVILERIVAAAGYTFESDFFNTISFDRIYTAAFNGSVYPLPTSALSLENRRFYVGLNTGVTESASASSISPYYIQNMVDSGTGFYSGFYDNTNMYDVGGTPVGFTVPVNGAYNVSGYATISGMSGTASVAWIALYNVDTDEWVTNTTLALGSVSGGAVNLQGETEYQLESGVNYNLAVRFNTSSTTTFNLTSTGFGTGLFVELATVNSGQTVDVARNMPDYKQADFIKDLQKQFNLVFVPNNKNSNLIEITTFKNYQSSGTIKDWSDYVDYNKDYSIKPTANLQSRDYLFSYTAGNDFANQYWVKSIGKTYGQYTIEDTENDFATGQIEIKSGHQPLTLSRITETGMVIHKAVDEDGKIVKKPKSMIGFYDAHEIGGVTNPDNLGGLFINDQGTTRQVDVFPFYGHTCQMNPLITDPDLNFGFEALTYGAVAPTNNLYVSYWQDYVNELYSNEARVAEYTIHLTPAQIADFEWNDNIFIKDDYWRVLSIDYSPNTPETSKVTLIKRITSFRACEFAPFSIDTGGEVTFKDADGVTSVGSETCCVYYGYNWSNNACFAPAPIEGVVNPVNVPVLQLPGNRIIEVAESISPDAGTTVLADPSIANLTVSLPDANTHLGETVVVTRLVGSFDITVDSVTGTDTVNTNASEVIVGDHTTYTYQSVGGSQWITIASGGALAPSANIYTTNGDIGSATRELTGTGSLSLTMGDIGGGIGGRVNIQGGVNIFNTIGGTIVNRLDLVSSTAVFTSALGTGLQYDGDYSATFTDESMVSKRYVASYTKTAANINAPISTSLSITAAVGDCIVVTPSSAITITLPTASSSIGRNIIIKRLTGAFDTTIDGNGTETIDGSLTAILTADYESITVKSTGTGWIII